jgi:hypothetical protein
VSTIVALIVGVVLAGATVAGVASSLSNNNDRPAASTSNVQLYGSR